MKASFWHKCWETDEPAFHQSDIHPILIERFAGWAGSNASEVFVPLCGKSQDMLYISQSHRVLGSELSDVACADFYRQNDLGVQRVESARYNRYQGDLIDLLAGDFFALQSEDVQSCELIYDRAALVALPPQLREQYVIHLRHLFSAKTKLFLLSLEYPTDELEGPPFSVPEAEVMRLFDGCKIERVATLALEDNKFAQRTLRVSQLDEVAYFITF